MTTIPSTTSEVIERRVPFDLERDENGDGLTLTGYAAVFNEQTRIDSWEGLFDEQISPGAFRKTIRDGRPLLQFDHGSHPLIGSLPIGTLTSLKEDRHGLKVVGRLHDNWLVEPVRDAIRDGSVTGMSFRFNVVRDEWDESRDVPLRTIKEVRLHEVGPVVWPAYEQTTVGVRSHPPEVERVLSDPALRAELARALVCGTPSDDADNEGVTSSGAAVPTEPLRHSVTTRRDALIAVAKLKEVT